MVPTIVLPVFPVEGGRIFLGALALGAACAFAVPARAEEPQPVPEIRVEAPRPGKGEPERDPIAAATVIGREEIESEPLGVPALVGRGVGARVREVGGLGSFSTLSIRGSSSNQVRVFLDGVPLDRGVSGTVDLSSLVGENLDRIEIYRGVAPLSLGGSAIGGVLSAKSRRPTRSALDLLAGGGSFGFRKAALHAARAEEGEPLRLSLALAYEGAENDFSFINDNGTPANGADDFTDKRRDSDYDRGDALVRLTRDLPREGTLSLTEVFHARETGVNTSVGASGGGSRLLEVFSTTSLELELPRLGARSSVEGRTFFGFSRTAFGVGPVTSDDRDFLLGASLLYGHYLSDWLKGELFGEYRYERFDSGGNLGGSLLGPASRRHFYTLAAGLEWEAVAEKLLLTVQGRFEDARDRLRESNAGTPAGRSSSRRAATARLGARWRPAKALTFSFNGAQAVRFPDFTELFGNSGFIRGDPDLREEKSRSVDLGVAWKAADLRAAARLSIEARYFFIDTEDLIVFQANSQGVLLVRNIPGSRTHGAELVASWRAPRYWSAEGNLTYLRARQKPNGNFRVPFVAEWEAYAKVGAEEDFVGAIARAGLWIDFEYVAKNFLGPSNLGEVPKRRVWGAGIFADFWRRALTATLEIKNLTNERDLRNFSNQPLPGLTLLAALRWRPI